MIRLLLPLALLAACAPKSGGGEVTYREIDSAALGGPKSYALYTPPGWDRTTPLPLVVFLHGGGDDETALDKHPIAPATFDRWIAEGVLPPFVMVVPDGDQGFWRNWHDGSHRYADWVMQDVIGDVRAQLPLLPAREGQHLMGISMGGAGTLYLALEHREAFASATVLSAPVFTVDEAMKFLDGSIVAMIGPMDRIFGPPERERIAEHNAYEVLQGPADLGGLDLLIGWGTADIAGVAPSNRQFHEHLVERGVPHEKLVYAGGHRWADWSKVYPVALCLRLKGEACALPEQGGYRLDRFDGRDVLAVR